jgi:RimJ/RimL family protein N-acetyltransferase
MDLTLRELGTGDEAVLQALLESDPDYTVRVTGYPPGPSDALSLLMVRPESVPESDKVVLGIFDDAELVAVVDLLHGYPEPSFVFIGLLLVHGSRQGSGVGAAAMAAVERYAGQWPEVRRFRLAVVDTNAAVLGFWRRMGFEPTGETRQYRYDHLESTTRLYERDLFR